MTKIFGPKKIECADLPLGGAINTKNCSWVTGGPIDLKFGIQYLCPEGNKIL